ncbi:pyridoxal-phosphate dependent enzyme [Persicobacter diffluens]|uniref:Cystathionine beta-synthase n=1 Tax=Persicobacter diffluens TaxID=981 RepID=A0AAN4W374_9BACT|nr:cystathionine beta-synthase [Persicobacter diffluens]
MNPTEASLFYDTLSMIGNTPMVKVNRLDTGPCSLFLKLESLNPGGSIKDRIGLSMINEAEKQGLIQKGSTLIEATAGNTGLGLALVAAIKGYRLILVIPDKMSQEKVQHLRAMGAEIVMTRSDVGKGHPEYYQDLAEKIASETPGSYFINQFNNPANPKAHYETTGPEIAAQLKGEVDAVVVGVGSSGTITGLSQYFREHYPNTEIILADPQGSILADYINKGSFDEAGSWMVEGIGEDFVPDVGDFSHVKEAITVTDAESLETARTLLQTEGILAGSSSGTLIVAALAYCKKQDRPKNVVTFVCDTGNKYLSKMYNDFWMRDQGFLKVEKRGDLRDVLTRNFQKGEVVTLKPTDKISHALRRMKLYEISQLPVMEDHQIVGIVDESDLLISLKNHSSDFDLPIRDIMSTQLRLVQKDDSVEVLHELFRKGLVPILMDGEEFLGLITQIDLLNHMRLKFNE